jgi:hypothetical protein
MTIACGASGLPHRAANPKRRVVATRGSRPALRPPTVTSNSVMSSISHAFDQESREKVRLDDVNWQISSHRSGRPPAQYRFENRSKFGPVCHPSADRPRRRLSTLLASLSPFLSDVRGPNGMQLFKRLNYFIGDRCLDEGPVPTDKFGRQPRGGDAARHRVRLWRAKRRCLRAN